MAKIAPSPQPVDVRIILDAAWQAVAEGEAIVNETLERYGFKKRHGAGPMQRAWQRGRTKQGDEPDYYLSEDDQLNIRAVRTMLASMPRLAKKPGLQKAAYRDVGIHVLRLQRRRERGEWTKIVQRECSLSMRHANELIAVATGAKPLATLNSRLGPALAPDHTPEPRP